MYLHILHLWRTPEDIVGTIRFCFQHGRPWPTAVGTIAGGFAGACAGFFLWFLAIPGAVLGMIVGATFAAVRFPKRRPALTFPPASRSWTALGPPRRFWTSHTSHGDSSIVLLECGLYMAVEEPRLSSATKTRLKAGDDPCIPGGELVPLDWIRSLRLPSPGLGGIEVGYQETESGEPSAGKPHQRLLEFRSLDDREDFFTELEERLGQRFVYEPHHASVFGALLRPALAILVLIGASLGTAAIAEYWQTRPPRLQSGFGTSPIVQPFLELGPSRVLFFGVVPLVLAVGWFVYAGLYPPRKHEFKLR